MAGKVFFSVSMSLDGFSAPESMDGILATPEQRKQDPRLERSMAQWMELHAWIFPLVGAGARLFDGVDASRVALAPVRSEPSSRVTHLTYAVHA
jgi:hypothetical protein